MQGVYLAEHGLDFVRTCFSLYGEGLLFVGIFFVGILLLLTKKIPAQFLSFYTIFLFFTIFNPLAVKMIFGRLGMESVYYRFFWLLPINIVIAYILVSVVKSQKNRIYGVFVALFCIGMICFLGNPIVKKESIINLPDNLYKVSDEVLEVSEHLHRVSEDETPRVAVSDELIMVMRQYDASLQLTVKRDYLLGWRGMPDFQWTKNKSDYWEQEAIMKTIYGGDVLDSDGFLKALESTETEFLVVSKNVGVHEYLLALGLNFEADTVNYIIYSV